jgi:hypothetical protein
MKKDFLILKRKKEIDIKVEEEKMKVLSVSKKSKKEI